MTTTVPSQVTIHLTDEQIDLIAKKYAGMGGVEDYRSFARDIAMRLMSDIADVVRNDSLEAAAKIADAEYQEFLEASAQNNGRESDFAFGSVNSAERIGNAIRELKKVPVDADPDYLVEKAALICDRTARELEDAPAKAIFECAEKIRQLKGSFNGKGVATTEVLAVVSRICDSAGHHWSGRPALIMFGCATRIRELERTGVEEGAE